MPPMPAVDASARQAVGPAHDGAAAGAGAANEAVGGGGGGMPLPPLFCDAYSDVASMFTVGRKLGQGNFAKVVQASAKHALPACGLRAGEQVAIKIVKKPSAMAAPVLEMLRSEIAILRAVRHPNIVRLYEVLETPGKLYLVMQLCSGGELFERIVRMGVYSEEDARYFTFKLLNAVLYLHDSSICHRDLKPENILLSTPHEDAELLITDFGLGKVMARAGEGVPWREVALRTRCGTPGYAAPEVISSAYGPAADRRYGLACDMWSVGVILFILLSACPPFAARDDEEMQRQVCSPGALAFPQRHWGSISAEAVDLIRGLLVVDPSKRLTALEALQHPWVVSVGAHQTDLFNADSHGQGSPHAAAAPAAASPRLLRQRFDEFNAQRTTMRTGRRAGEGRGGGEDGAGADGAEPRGLAAEGHAGALSAAQLGLPQDEAVLRLFRCACEGRLGQLVVATRHVGFAATDGASLWLRPTSQLASVTTARYIASNAATDNSLVLAFSDGSRAQLDGFWQRDACLQLLARADAERQAAAAAAAAQQQQQQHGGSAHTPPPPPPREVAAGACAGSSAASPLELPSPGPSPGRASPAAGAPAAAAAADRRRLSASGRPLRLTRSSVD